MGHLTAYTVDQHAVVADRRPLASITAIHGNPIHGNPIQENPVAGDTGCGAASVRTISLVDRGVWSEVPSASTAPGNPAWNEAALMRSIRVSVIKLRIGLWAFLVFGVLSGFLIGWSFAVFVSVGLLFAVTLANAVGPFLRRRAAQQAVGVSA